MGILFVFIVLLQYLNNFQGCQGSCDAVQNSYTVRSSKDTDGTWGTWGAPAYCPGNQYVYGYRIRSDDPCGDDCDDTAMNNVELLCKPRSGCSTYTAIQSLSERYGKWYPRQFCSKCDSPIVGFSVKQLGDLGRGDQLASTDDTGTSNVRFYCKDGEKLETDVKADFGKWTNKVSCPEGEAAVGLISRVELHETGYDDTTFNGMRIICAKF